MLEIKKSLGLKNVDKVFRNLGRENLINNAIDHDGAVIAYNGATIIETGIFTGRSPKDKYFVSQDASEKFVAWGDVNQRVSQEIYEELLENAKEQLSNKDLYVSDVYCGASPTSRKSIRFITEIAWQAHFIDNMFIMPETEELDDFVADFTVYNACKTVNKDWEKHGLNSEVFVVFNIEEKE